MKKETMLKAVNDISDDFIAEAAPSGWMPKEKPAFGWLNGKVLAGILAAVLMIPILPVLMRPHRPDIQTVTPYHVCETIREAEDITGFTFAYPETYKDWKVSQIRVYTGSMIEVIYADADGETARIRKAEGNDDISGDYNAYAQETILHAGTREITARGDDDSVSLMTWSENGYSCSVSFSEPLSSEDAAAFAAEIQ